ncbi:hypothetical protein L9F63_018811, partial [Diploptera punctata]
RENCEIKRGRLSSGAGPKDQVSDQRRIDSFYTRLRMSSLRQGNNSWKRSPLKMPSAVEGETSGRNASYRPRPHSPESFINTFPHMFLYFLKTKISGLLAVVLRLVGPRLSGETSGNYKPQDHGQQPENLLQDHHSNSGLSYVWPFYFLTQYTIIFVSIVSVVVVGNFTEEEIEGTIVRSEDQGQEYPLQRDEVQTKSSRDDRTNSLGAAVGNSATGSENSSPRESKQYIGLVIGVLTAVILLLMGAIMFIVFRNRRLKSHAGHSVLPGPFGGSEKGVTINMKVSVEDPAEVDKSALYHEPYNINMYSSQNVKQLQGKDIHARHPSSPDYT